MMTHKASVEFSSSREDRLTVMLPKFRLRSAEDRVRFLESESFNHWSTDRRSALELQECESVVDEVNELRLEISDLDCVVHMWLTDNDTFDDELNAKLTKLFAGWLNVAKNIGKSTAELVGAGYGVRGIEELRTGIREVESALAPSYEMTTAMKMRLEAAQAEHTAERTIDGLFDS